MIVAVISMVVALAVLVYAAHLSVVYHRFNDGIRQWAESLDSSTRDAIARASRELLREMDERISEENNNNQKNKENG